MAMSPQDKPLDAVASMWFEEIYNRTIQTQFKLVQTVFTLKPNYFLMLAHFQRTEDQLDEAQTSKTSCKPDPYQLELGIIYIHGDISVYVPVLS